MNTGFIMLPRQVENELSLLDPFDYKLMIKIISNCVFINQYEHKGKILNKGEWERSYRQLQKDMKYIKKGQEITPTLAKIRASIERLKQHKFLTTCNTGYNTVFKLSESLVNQCFPKEKTQDTTQVTTQVLDDVTHNNNNVLNINNNVLNNKVLKKELTNISSVNKYDNGSNFAEAFLLAYGKHPSPLQIQEFYQYIEEGIEEALICHAIQLSAKVTSSVSYLWGVLRNWTKQGIKTLESAMTVKKTSQKQVLVDHEESERKRSFEEFGW